jgi:hypothetical protein
MFCIPNNISRWWHSMGFGIQSPWAYSFVKDVIGEKSSYYGYDRIDREYQSKRERRRQKLYLRLRNRYPNCRIYSLEHLQQLSDAGAEGIRCDEVFVLEGIRTSRSAFNTWLRLRDSDAVGITFDLYDIAICFPRDNKFKQHYKLKY